MRQTSKKVIFFGNERLATGVSTNAPTLRALIDNGYDIAAVIASDSPQLSRKNRSLEVKTLAEEHNIPVLLPHRLSEIESQIRDLKPEIGVLVAFGKIVPQKIIDLFPRGIVNIHPSLLPLHRGPTPIESVILNGDKVTGVSIMQLVKSMDAGPVFAQVTIQLEGNEDKVDLAEKLLEAGKDLLLKCLPQILDGKLEPTAQDSSQATYDTLIGKDDGVIDWRKPASQLEREIRAYATWPKSRTTLANTPVIVTEAHVVSADTKHQPGEIILSKKELMIACDQNLLSIDHLKPEGKSEMPAISFLAGYRNSLTP